MGRFDENVCQGFHCAKSTFILGQNKKSRIQETLNYLAYADSSSNAKWLKTVCRKKRWPIPWAIVRFKTSSFTLNIEKKKISFSTLEATFGVIFSLNTLLIFFSLKFFSFRLLNKQIGQKNSQYTLDFEKIAVAINCWRLLVKGQVAYIGLQLQFFFWWYIYIFFKILFQVFETTQLWNTLMWTSLMWIMWELATRGE